MLHRRLHRIIAALVVLAGLGVFAQRNAEADIRPIQDQGSSPYCLVAADSYLAGVSMWTVEAEYHRRNLPTWDGVTPYNTNVLNLLTELYGVQFHVYGQNDWTSVRNDLINHSRPTAMTGNGHTIVVLSIRNGVVRYLDSTTPGQIQYTHEPDLQSWWDGWAWYRTA